MSGEMYSGKERFLTALDKKKPDRVPIFEINIDDVSVVGVLKALNVHTGSLEASSDGYEKRKELLDLYCLLVEELDLDAATSYPAIGLYRIDNKFGKDKYGITYQYSSHGEPVVILGPVKERKDISNLKLLEKIDDMDFANTKYLISKFGDDKAQVLNILDPFKLSWQLRGGMQHLLVDYITDSRIVHDLAEVTTEYSIALMEKAKSVGVDVIALIGDLASEKNTIFSPEQFRQFLQPYYKKIVDAAHKIGFRIIKHSDGMLWPIMDEIVNTGFDGYHPIQPDCMDIGEFRNRYNNKICIVGNIDCRELLCHQGEKEVDRVVEETIKIAGEDGAYIMCSSNSIHPDVKPENYIAMVKATHRYGVYDLEINKKQ